MQEKKEETTIYFYKPKGLFAGDDPLGEATFRINKITKGYSHHDYIHIDLILTNTPSLYLLKWELQPTLPKS